MVDTKSQAASPTSPAGYLLDLGIYLTVLFTFRQLYLPGVPYMARVVLGSLLAVGVATWRMRARGVRWADLGLRKPENLGKTLIVTAVTVVAVVISIISFEILKDLLPIELAPDTSSDGSRFGDLEGNFALLLSIIGIVWLESALEELMDRGFLLNWLERLFARPPMATILAVLIQAILFGFRHSYDLSERSVTVGLIGLILGIAYVACGRRLWPVILAHCVLNSLSMLERVF